jgi:hypothetical protein
MVEVASLNLTHVFVILVKGLKNLWVILGLISKRTELRNNMVVLLPISLERQLLKAIPFSTVLKHYVITQKFNVALLL